MKTLERKSAKNVIGGFFLVGAVTFASAQTNQKTVDTTKKAIAEAAVQVQTQPQLDNPTIVALKAQADANPKDAQVLAKLATAYQDVQNWNGALETWTKISTLLPDWAPSYYSQAYVYQSMKDDANAKTSYEKYISMVKPEELEANKKNLAYAHFFVAHSNAQTDKEKAKQHIAKSLEYDATNQEAVKLNEILNTP